MPLKRMEYKPISKMTSRWCKEYKHGCRTMISQYEFEDIQYEYCPKHRKERNDTG